MYNILSFSLSDPFSHSPLGASNNRLAAMQSKVLGLAFQIRVKPQNGIALARFDFEAKSGENSLASLIMSQC